jgi:hypothetical protein
MHASRLEKAEGTSVIRRQNPQKNARYLHTIRAGQSCRHTVYGNSILQSMSSWWMARKFLDGMRTGSPHSRTLATHCGLPRMHRKLGDTLDAIPTDWWSLCSPDWGKGGQTAFTCMRKARVRMVRCACRAGREPLMGRGPMRKEWAECSSLPAIPRYHDPPTSFPQPAWKSRAGMWEESAWRTIASVDFV